MRSAAERERVRKLNGRERGVNRYGGAERERKGCGAVVTENGVSGERKFRLLPLRSCSVRDMSADRKSCHDYSKKYATYIPISYSSSG